MKVPLPSNNHLFLARQRRSPPLLLLSACLAGDAVRYDGAHKLHLQLNDALQNKVSFSKVCPEVYADFGIPRPPVQLRETAHGLRVQGRDKPIDVTATLQQASDMLSDNLARQPLCAGVLQSRSPSCGIASTPVLNESGHIVRTDSGLFATAISRQCPYLPLWPDHLLSTEFECLALFSQALLIQELMYLLTDEQLPGWLQYYQPLFEAWLPEIERANFSDVVTAESSCRGVAIELNKLFLQFRMQWITLHYQAD